MCYHCDECQKSTKPYQKMLKRVIYKPVQHQNGTHGRQIAKEIKLCPACMAKASAAA
jgi:hypothetical protein